MGYLLGPFPRVRPGLARDKILLGTLGPAVCLLMSIQLFHQELSPNSQNNGNPRAEYLTPTQPLRSLQPQGVCVCASLSSKPASHITWGEVAPWDHGQTFGYAGLFSTAFAVLPEPHLFPVGEEDGRDQSKLETKVWEAHNPLVDKQIDQFLVVAR